MDASSLFKSYFEEGTPGHQILMRFYGRYRGILQGEYAQFEDFSHEIFINLTSIDASVVLKEENYIHRAMKNQCWKLFSEQSNQKNMIISESQMDQSEDLPEPPLQEVSVSHYPTPVQALEAKDLMRLIMRFKRRLESTDLHIFNSMIDTVHGEQLEIAKKLSLNAGTVRTKVRRLRLAFEEHLKNEGFR